jgi:hypothetical protein
MNKLLLGVSLLALLAPAAYAQQSSEPATTAVSGQIEPGKYRVFFTFNQATLTPDGARVVGEAAEEYKRTDAARIAVTGHTDLSGSPAYNQALSERRAEAVQGALVWLGVPASVIGEGENDPLVPTAEGVREARNRRVEIEIPKPAPAPAPVAPAPVAGAPEAGPPPAPGGRTTSAVGLATTFRRSMEAGRAISRASRAGPSILQPQPAFLLSSEGSTPSIASTTGLAAR